MRHKKRTGLLLLISVAPQIGRAQQANPLSAAILDLPAPYVPALDVGAPYVAAPYVPAPYFTADDSQTPAQQPNSAGGGQAPSLGDLGFPTNQTQADAQEQARLNRRSHMLQMHQRLGLITTAPLIATLITSGLAGGRSSSSATRDLHAALGSVTVGMYVWTASYAIRAPKISGTKTRGPIRLHKALAWVHGTGMILTPVLGAMALDQKDKGEKVHGIASAHGAAAWTTGIAYGLAIASVSFKF